MEKNKTKKTAVIIKKTNLMIATFLKDIWCWFWRLSNKNFVRVHGILQIANKDRIKIDATKESKQKK